MVLFVHDHKFPRNGNKVYYSYGFDDKFFIRYLSIFGQLNIIGRETKSNLSDLDLVSENVNFITLDNLRSLLNFKIRNKIKNEIINSDYIVIRLPSILGLYAAIVAKKNKKNYLVEVVGCAWDAIANKGIAHKPVALVIMFLMKKIIVNSKYVVYVTEKFLQERYPTRGMSIACSNVTLIEVSTKDLENRLNKINKLKLNEKITIGTCATIDVVYKGQEDVIKAMSQLIREGYQIEYQLVGGGSRDYLKKVAKKYGVINHVKFIGSLKHEEVFNWLEQIDIYVHPSKQEGLSRAIIEAMSKGCPILGANAGGIYEQIDKEFVYDKGNVDGIISTFKKFNKVNMLEQSQKNHEKSKSYIKDKLYLRREAFFNKFIDENQIDG